MKKSKLLGLTLAATAALAFSTAPITSALANHAGTAQDKMSSHACKSGHKCRSIEKCSGKKKSKASISCNTKMACSGKKSK